jgi:hypothetical protein
VKGIPFHIAIKTVFGQKVLEPDLEKLERNKSKIIYDAYHLMVAYEIEEARREGKRYYIPVAWKVVSLYSTRIDVKHEFNANNKDLYRQNAILAEGRVE